MSYQWLTLWSYGETFLAAAWLTLQVTLLAFMLAVADLSRRHTVGA